MRRRLNAAFVVSALVLTGGAIGAPANGQNILTTPQFYADPFDVARRPRPDYDAQGVPIGSFLLYPSIEVGEYYDSNVYATETNEEDDFVTTYVPSISLVSDWNNHAFGANAYVAGGLFADHSDENFTDYGVSAAGRLDVRRSTSLFAATSWDHLHEDRGSPEDVNGDEPSRYDEFFFGLGGGTRQGRFSFGLDGNYTHLNYENVTDRTGNFVNQQDRNQDIYEAIARFGYEFKSDYEAFVEANYTVVEYENNPDDNGFNRNNDGWRIDGGIAFNITDTLAGDVYVGYIERSYEDSRFQDFSSPDLGADIYWSITPLTSAHALIIRTVDETTQAGASSILQTSGGVELSHELRRNVILGANVGYTDYDYEGISRNDDLWLFGADAEYLINRNFYVGGNADYITRDSNFVNESYDQFVIGIFVGAQM